MSQSAPPARGIANLTRRLLEGGWQEDASSPDRTSDSATSRLFLRRLLEQTHEHRFAGLDPVDVDAEVTRLLDSLAKGEVWKREASDQPVPADLIDHLTEPHGFAEACLLRWRQIRDGAPEAALDVALLAAACAERCDDREVALPRESELRCRAWIAVSFAHLRRADLEASHRAVQRAGQATTDSEVSVATRARLSALEGQIEAERGHHARALDLFDRAEEGFRQLGDRARLALVRSHRGTVLAFYGAPDAALEVLREALDDLDDAIHAEIRAQLYLRIGHYELLKENLPAALGALSQARSWSSLAPDRLLQARILWSEGLLAAAEERWSRAISRLIEARDEFVAQGTWREAGLVALQLASVHLQQQCPEEAGRLAREVIEWFGGHAMVERDVLVLNVLNQSVATGCLTPTLLEEVARSLQSGNNPLAE